MARKVRIEYPGATYHIISRGNYRKDLFTIAESGRSFEKALFEVAERCEWKLHAYVIMSNHYHLALQIKEPNLVEGMRWLQSTFANRFNRFTGEKGHVFQGRYKSLLIEPERPLLGLVDYIHLNPVRAGIVSLKDLKTYKLSSFPKFFAKQPKSGLFRKDFLSRASLPDTLSGMKHYWERLEVVDEGKAEHREAMANQYCRGWIIAGKAFRKQIVEQYSEEEISESIGKSGKRELREAHWETVLRRLMEEIQKSEVDIKKDKKAAKWKVSIARQMRRQCTASNPWLGERLNMGHASRVSNLINGNI